MQSGSVSSLKIQTGTLQFDGNLAKCVYPFAYGLWEQKVPVLK
jgi:hypothetical protein